MSQFVFDENDASPMEEDVSPLRSRYNIFLIGIRAVNFPRATSLLCSRNRYLKNGIYIYILTLPPLIIVHRAVSSTKRRKKKKEEADGINYRQIDYGWAF